MKLKPLRTFNEAHSQNSCVKQLIELHQSMAEKVIPEPTLIRINQKIDEKNS